MTKGAVGETMQKERKKKREAATKRCQETEKKGRENRRLQSKNTEISARKALKMRKMPPTKHSKML